MKGDQNTGKDGEGKTEFGKPNLTGTQTPLDVNSVMRLLPTGRYMRQDEDGREEGGSRVKPQPTGGDCSLLAGPGKLLRAFQTSPNRETEAGTGGP